MEKIAADMANGTIHFIDHTRDISEEAWAAHPKFTGVYLKHLIRGDETSGAFSSHLVRIEPDGCLDTHIHDAQMELHEIVSGGGTCRFAGRELAYHPGKTAVIPMGEAHRVKAGEQGLVLMAKFFPALV